MPGIIESSKSFIKEFGEISLFTGKVIKQFFRPPFEHGELIKQAFFIGNKTIPLVSITAFILGLVLTIQSRPVLSDFGAESLLPGMVSVSIVREIGPVITALLIAGKVGSGIGAELGSMKITEQIDAMEVSGTNPMKFVVATRVLAATLTTPFLVIYADAIALYGSYVAININSNISLSLFFSLAFDVLNFSDIFPAIVKTFFFGFFIGIIGSFKGYNAGRGTESVGEAANSAVVAASLSIFIIDLVAVQLTDLIQKFNL